MKNFFKNLFGKKYPQRNDDQESGMRRVYAGPSSRKKRMQCVYAGPGMMPRDREKDKDVDNMREVYAGPPMSDKEETMKCVYMGPPIDEDVIIEEDDILEGVYMGPPVNGPAFIEEEDDPMEEVYMGPEPDIDEPVESKMSEEAEELYGSGESDETGNSQLNQIVDLTDSNPSFLMAYAGPAHIPSMAEQMKNAINDPNQFQPNTMMVYYGPMGPRSDNSLFINQAMAQSGNIIVCKACGKENQIAFTGFMTPLKCGYCGADLPETTAMAQLNGTSGSSTAPETELDEYKFCPVCGKKLPANIKYCCDCGTDTSNEKIFRTEQDNEEKN